MNSPSRRFLLLQQPLDQANRTQARPVHVRSVVQHEEPSSRSGKHDESSRHVLQRRADDRLREAEARTLALKIAAQCPKNTATTEFIKQQIPKYTPLSETDLLRSPTRPREARWQQIVGNVISHQKTRVGPFAQGYSVRTKDGISVTERGINFLNNMGFVVE